jgi:hypothetical protein
VQFSEDEEIGLARKLRAGELVTNVYSYVKLYQNESNKHPPLSKIHKHARHRINWLL